MVEPGDKSRRHEESDANAKVIALSGIGLFILTVMVLFLMGWLLSVLLFRQARLEKLPLSMTEAGQAPPGPRLQVDPEKELEEMRETEEALLNSYGWADKEQGIARIPVTRAMELLAERGFPAGPARKEK